MKKIDKILEFLFHTKWGIAILVGVALALTLTFSGCFAECGDCLGCGDCGDCNSACSDCKMTCGTCVFTCADCNKADCGSSCNGCERSTCQCGTCVCTSTPNCAGCGCGSSSGGSSGGSSSNSVYLTVLLADGTRKNFYVSKNIENGYAVYDLRTETVPEDIAKYYSSMGYYTAGGVLAVDSDGYVVDAKALVGSYGVAQGGFNLHFAGVETKKGEPVLVFFETEHEELRPDLNAVRVTIGNTITNFPEISLEGYTFKGWRIKGDDSAPIVSVTNGVTEFHLYSFKAEVANTLTLVPVFEAK